MAKAACYPVEPGSGEIGYGQLKTNDGFSAIVREYSPKMYSACLRILGKREDAEDATQDALAQAWKKRETFRNESSPQTWLRRIAINEAYTILRKRGRREYVDIADVESDDTFSKAQRRCAPDRVYERRLKIKALKAAFGDLKPIERKILSIYGAQDRCKLEAVINYLEVSEPAAAKTRVHRAKQKLLRHLHREAMAHGVAVEEILPWLSHDARKRQDREPQLITPDEVLELLDGRLPEESLGKLRRLFERGVDDLQFFVSPCEIERNSRRIEERLSRLGPIDSKDKTAASAAAINVVYSQGRKYGGDPLSFFNRHRNVFGAMTRSELQRECRGLYDTLYTKGQLDMAFPSKHTLLTAERKEAITKALVRNSGNIRSTAREMNCDFHAVKECGLAAGIDMIWTKKLDELEVQEIRDALRKYGTASAAAKHLTCSTRTVYRYAREQKPATPEEITLAFAAEA